MIAQNGDGLETSPLLENVQIFGSLDFLGILIRRKWLVAAGLLVGLLLSFLVYWQTKPQYESAAQIHVTSKGLARIFQSGEISSGYDAYMSGYYISYHVLPTHAVIIRSPVIVREAIRNYGLDALDSFADTKDLTNTIVGGLSVVKGSGEKDGAEANILTLTYRGASSEDCQVVLSAVIASYQDYLGDSYQNVSRDTVELIAKAKDDLQKQLIEKEEQYREFRREAPLMWQSESGVNVYAMRLASIEKARGECVVRRASAGTRAEALRLAVNEGATRQSLALMTKRLARNVMEANALQETSRDWQSELLPLHVQEQMLMQLYGPEHPRVKALQAELAMRTNFYRSRDQEHAKDELSDDYLDTYTASLKQEVREAEMQEATLTELFKEQHNLAKKHELIELQDEQIRADIDRTKELFRSVVSRLQEINLVKDYGGYETRVLVEPGLGGKVRPTLWISLSMGCLLGLLGGLGLAFLVDMADKSFRSAEEIRAKLGLPVLAHVPVLSVDGQAAEGFDVTVVSHYDPKSREAEAFRRVRTSLYFGTKGLNNRVIQITSPDPADGKTTLAANLAVSIAQSGKRVLIIDADFRRPRLQKMFGTSNEAGFTQVIKEEKELDDVIAPTGVENLDLLVCGPTPPNPAELLSSPRFKQTVEACREKYDFVIIDTPPVLAVSDPMAIAPCVDGVLIAIRLSKSGRPNATRTIEQLTEVGATVIGIVVNGVGGGSRYGQAYDYGGSRYYRYEDDYLSSRQTGSYFVQSETPQASDKKPDAT